MTQQSTHSCYLDLARGSVWQALQEGNHTPDVHPVDGYTAALVRCPPVVRRVRGRHQGLQLRDIHPVLLQVGRAAICVHRLERCARPLLNIVNGGRVRGAGACTRMRAAWEGQLHCVGEVWAEPSKLAGIK